ncbi:MAG: hypothetical protein QFX35_02045 [Candidatus Verstraetearchaeota archaeon]|nr:hypothetical protein [Candidatus Verstraetearchaeota archaeon]
MSDQASRQSSPKPEGVYRKMYYIRAIFAVIGGFLTGGLNIRGELGIAVGIVVFLVSFLFFRNFEPFSSVPEKKKHYMTGIFMFFLLWFAVWVISINLVYPVS